MNSSFTSPSQPGNENSGWDRFLWWMAAADPQLMKDCGPDRFRYSIIGYTVMATWIFATLAWGYFFSTLLTESLLIIPCALFFGFIILTIDRGLIAGMNSNGGKNRLLPLAFRIVLALTIGFFLSQPVVLWLFEKDVDAHLPVIKEKKTTAYLAQVRQENAITLQQAKTEIERIRNEQKRREQEIADLKSGYIRETDGTGGSGKIGEYTIAKVKKLAWLKAEEDLIVWKREQQPMLDSALAKEKRTEEHIAARMAEFEKGLNDGFLIRIETLDDLMLLHPPVQYRYRLVIFLIMLIELMPLLTKLMMPSGLYEEKLNDAVNAQRTTLQLERGARQAMENKFYEQAAKQDQLLQEQVLAEIDAWRREQASEQFRTWKQQPGPIRKFWNSIKTSLFYFQKN